MTTTKFCKKINKKYFGPKLEACPSSDDHNVDNDDHHHDNDCDEHDDDFDDVGNLWQICEEPNGENRENVTEDCAARCS